MRDPFFGRRCKKTVLSALYDLKVRSDGRADRRNPDGHIQQRFHCALAKRKLFIGHWHDPDVELRQLFYFILCRPLTPFVRDSWKHGFPVRMNSKLDISESDQFAQHRNKHLEISLGRRASSPAHNKTTGCSILFPRLVAID